MHDEQPMGFAVHLDEFSGPFDALLALISKHKLEVTGALLEPGDRRVPAVSGRRARTGTWRRPATSWWWLRPCSTKVVEAAARCRNSRTPKIWPCWSRDLLFARLMQYRAYKGRVGHVLADDE